MTQTITIVELDNGWFEVTADSEDERGVAGVHRVNSLRRAFFVVKDYADDGLVFEQRRYEAARKAAR